MLNFTHRGSTVDAQYNGRFVFRASDLDGVNPVDTLYRLAEGNEHALSDTDLAHEYLHWKLFRASRFGVETIGRRFRARRSFLACRLGDVVAYYSQRTAFFCTAREVHERIVEELQDRFEAPTLVGLKQAKLTAKQREQLQYADVTAREASRQLGVSAPLSDRLVDYLLGALVVKEYSLQAYVPNAAGELRLREISLSSPSRGVINAAFETEVGAQGVWVRAAKTVRRRMNREKWHGGYDHEALAKWACLKFSSESTALQSLAEADPSLPILRGHRVQDYLDDYAEQISEFAIRHTSGCRDAILAANLAVLIRECSRQAPASATCLALAKQFERFDSRILYFFYVHGN